MTEALEEASNERVVRHSAKDFVRNEAVGLVSGKGVKPAQDWVEAVQEIDGILIRNHATVTPEQLATDDKRSLLRFDHIVAEKRPRF